MRNEKTEIVRKFVDSFAQLGEAFGLLSKACTSISQAGQALSEYYDEKEKLEQKQTKAVLCG